MHDHIHTTKDKNLIFWIVFILFRFVSDLSLTADDVDVERCQIKNGQNGQNLGKCIFIMVDGDKRSSYINRCRFHIV